MDDKYTIGLALEGNQAVQDDKDQASDEHEMPRKAAKSELCDAEERKLSGACYQGWRSRYPRKADDVVLVMFRVVVVGFRCVRVLVSRCHEPFPLFR